MSKMTINIILSLIPPTLTTFGLYVLVCWKGAKTKHHQHYNLRNCLVSNIVIISLPQ